MADVLIRNRTNGGFQNLSLVDAGVLTAGNGIDITANVISIPAGTAGNGLTNTAGVLAVSVPGQGAPVAITTVGTGLLTAAAIVAGVCLRSGPTGAYGDATDTAIAILALVDNPVIGQCWDFKLVNTVAFANTITAGVGVTLAGTTLNTASLVRTYRVQVTGAATVTITGVNESTL